MADNVHQLNIFNFGKERKTITKPIRLIELFAGIGAQAKALEQLGANFEHWRTCEWAVNSIKSYNAIHIKKCIDYSKALTKSQLIDFLDGNISTNYNEPCNVKNKNEEWLRDVYNNCMANNNLMNIMTVKGKDLGIADTDKYEYIMTYSFPCQDLSLAGKRAGMETSQADGGTRSGLLWEVERILDELDDRPQILLMENVPEVIGKDNVQHFNKWLAKLESLGYTNYFQILNGKDYGIPQNRRRCFMVSLLGDYAYEFPIKIKLQYRLKDFLEKQVPERYYLTSKMIDYVLARTPIGDKEFNSANNIRSADTDKCSGTITTKGSGTGSSCRGEDTFIVDNMTQQEIDEEIYGKPKQYTKESLERIKDNVVDGDIAPCITANAMQSINHQNCALIKEPSEKNLKQELCDKLIEDGKVQESQVIRHSYTNNRLSGKRPMETVQNTNPNLSPTIDTRCDCLGVVVDGNYGNGYSSKNVYNEKGLAPTIRTGNHGLGTAIKTTEKRLRIRKLIPLETLKLMGFEKSDEQAMRCAGMSDAAIYHCSGDSIIVTVLMAIFGQMFPITEEELQQKINNYVKQVKEG